MSFRYESGWEISLLDAYTGFQKRFWESQRSATTFPLLSVFHHRVYPFSSTELPRLALEKTGLTPQL